MLAPRFTLRTALVLLTVGSAVAVVLRAAVGGAPWAIGVSVGLLSMVLSIALQAAAFAVSLTLSRGREGEP